MNFMENELDMEYTLAQTMQPDAQNAIKMIVYRNT